MTTEAWAATLPSIAGGRMKMHPNVAAMSRAMRTARRRCALRALVLTLARIGRGALVITIPALHGALAASFPTRDALLTKLTTTHAITLAPDLLAGYRRAGLGGEDRWLAALDESACE